MNNSKNRVLVFLVILLVCTNIAMLLYLTVFNHRGPGGPDPNKRGPGITNFLQNELHFSKEQMHQLDSLKQTHRAAIKPLFDTLGKSKDNFYLLLGKPGTPDSVIHAAANDIGRNQAMLDMQFFKNFTTLRGLCTAQQLQKFDSAMPGIASRMMQPWKNNPGRRRDSTNVNK